MWLCSRPLFCCSWRLCLVQYLHVGKGYLFWRACNEQKNKLFFKGKTCMDFERRPCFMQIFFHCLWSICVPGLYPAEAELQRDALIARHILAARHNLLFVMTLLVGNSFNSLLVVIVQQLQWNCSTSSGHSKGSSSWQEIIFDFPPPEYVSDHSCMSVLWVHIAYMNTKIPRGEQRKTLIQMPCLTYKWIFMMNHMES